MKYGVLFTFSFLFFCLIMFFRVSFVFFFYFSVSILAHGSYFTCICSLFFWLLVPYMLAFFSLSASHEHALRGWLLFPFVFFLCVCIHVMCLPFIVCCILRVCFLSALVLGRSYSLFRLSLFPKSVFNVSFAGFVLSFVPVLSFVTMVCVGSGYNHGNGNQWQWQWQWE